MSDNTNTSNSIYIYDEAQQKLKQNKREAELNKLNDKYDLIIGIDQSYEETGITIIYKNKFKYVNSIKLKTFKTNSEKRLHLKERLNNIVSKYINALNIKPEKVFIIIERIRLMSQGFVNINYIKSIGALNAIIIDVFQPLNINVYSVDTRSWKSRVIGTSKPAKNKYNVAEEKWLTIKYVIHLGLEKHILEEISSKRVKKHVFYRNNIKFKYNDNTADSVGICLYAYYGDHSKLQLEQ